MLTIITGATRGLGQALAMQLLAQPQACVLQISRNASEALVQVAAEHGSSLLQWQADLVDAEQVAIQLAQWLAEQQRVRWREIRLINNAAAQPERIAPVVITHAASLRQVLRVDLEAPMLLTAAFLRATEVSAAQGVVRKVLNISSGLARMALGSMASYSAAKAGLDQFTRCLAQEEAARAHGARVCALHPGVIDTGMQLQMRQTAEALFPAAGNFGQLHSSGLLRSAEQAAQTVLQVLEGQHFGKQVIVELPL
ncbi:MAG: SDR family NAD(P)-dependent oxidoreductase [Comamonas sp.]